jgi:hypothetical protein
MDHTAYPVFAMAFVRTTLARMDRLTAITEADFAPFITSRA